MHVLEEFLVFNEKFRVEIGDSRILEYEGFVYYYGTELMNLNAFLISS